MSHRYHDDHNGLMPPTHVRPRRSTPPLVSTLASFLPSSPFRLLTVVGLLGASLAVQAPVAAATLAATTTCGNSADNTGGLGVVCEVTIANTITASGGSVTVTVRECHGPAGAPEAACTTETMSLSEPVPAVNQCNDAENGAGATVRCSVRIVDTFVDQDPSAVGVTVNQCVGFG